MIGYSTESEQSNFQSIMLQTNWIYVKFVEAICCKTVGQTLSGLCLQLNDNMYNRQT